MKRNANKEFQCIYCNYTSITAVSLQVHAKTCRAPQDEERQRYLCLICGYCCGTLSSIKYHMHHTKTTEKTHGKGVFKGPGRKFCKATVIYNTQLQPMYRLKDPSTLTMPSLEDGEVGADPDFMSFAATQLPVVEVDGEAVERSRSAFMKRVCGSLLYSH